MPNPSELQRESEDNMSELTYKTCPTCDGEGGWMDSGKPSTCDDCGGDGIKREPKPLTSLEARKLAKEGAKIRMTDWHKDCFVYWDERYLCWKSQDSCKFEWDDIDIDGTWELYQEPEPEVVHPAGPIADIIAIEVRKALEEAAKILEVKWEQSHIGSAMKGAAKGCARAVRDLASQYQPPDILQVLEKIADLVDNNGVWGEWAEPLRKLRDWMRGGAK